jgi:AraC family transcriptional regulator
MVRGKGTPDQRVRDKGGSTVTPKITQKKKITLVGMDFFGNPFEKAGGWSEQNEIGRLWKRFENFYKNKKNSIKNPVSESGYELWIDFEGEKETKNKYIFVGVEVERIEDLPLELVAKILPETRYAVFTLKGSEIKSDWSVIWKKWLPEAGLKTSFDFMMEFYDCQRFKGMDNPDSELDIYVPIR